MRIRIRVGVSSIFNHISKLSIAFRESRQAIQYGKFLNTGRIVYITDVENKEIKHIMLSPEEIHEIDNIVRFGTNQELHDVLEAQKLAFNAQKNYHLAHDLYLISFANIILNFSQTISADTDDLIDGSMLQILQSFARIDDLFTWIETTIFELRKRYIDSSKTWVDEVLNDAIAFVDKHYDDPLLSLNMVCDYLNISISYLSMLLKREKNITFNKYVIQVRMEKAKELLRTTNHKIIDISLMTGYNEVYYFSHSFKKYTGMSPKQFREELYV
ncbi:MAG: helix-turn-helix transcriptional regulator [Candidatus Izemoplasmatales bacterium]